MHLILLLFWKGTFEQMAAAKMVAVSSGTVENFTILESADLNKIADTAKKNVIYL